MNKLVKNPLVSLMLGGALVAGLAFSLGFQSGAEKIAMVDTRSVMFDSKFGQKTVDQLNVQRAAFAGLLDYFKVNDVLTHDQAVLIKNLTIKDSPSDSDKATIEATKNQGAASMKEFTDLMTKPNATQADRDKLQEYSVRRNAMRDFTDQTAQEMNKIFNDNQTKKQTDLLDAAKAAIKDTAQKKGYTLVLDSGVVVYTANDKANDVTEEAKTALDAAHK